MPPPLFLYSEAFLSTGVSAGYLNAVSHKGSADITESSSSMCGSDGNTCVSECRACESHCISLALIFVQPTLDVILLEFITIVCCVVN